MSFSKESYNQIKGFVEKNTKNQLKIIAVSKNHSINSVKEAVNSGLRVFGENRVQEAINKFENIKKNYQDIELHLTGPLQTNKVKAALDIFDVFQTLDREKLAKTFFNFSEKIFSKTFFIQINTGKEKSKSGIYPEDADSFIAYCKGDLNFNIVGLMCIPPKDETPEQHFKLLRRIAEKNNLMCLSMGMSSDYKEAILNGATHIRIGTKLFGKRAL